MSKRTPFFYRLFSGLAAGLLLALSVGPAAAAQDDERLPAPVQLTPPNRAYVGTGNFLLMWTPISGAASYEILVESELPDSPTIYYYSHDNQHTVYDLPDNDSYYWAVRALHPTEEVFNSDFSPGHRWAFTTSSTAIVPMTPGFIGVTAGTQVGQVQINIGYSIRAEWYRVTRTDLTTAESTQFTIQLPNVQTSNYYDQTVVPGRHYLYTAQACNSAGCSEPFDSPAEGWAGECQASLPAPVQREPQPDDEFVFDTDSDFYHLVWDLLPGIETYQIQVFDQQTGALVEDDTVQGEDREMDNAGYLRWRVRAIDPVQGCPAGIWSGLWNYHAIVRPPPPTPVNVRASQGEYADRIVITWDNPPSISTANEYEIYWSLTPVMEDEQLHPNTGEETRYVDEFNLEPGRVYYYWVVACLHQIGCSEPSERAAGWLRTSSQSVLQQILFFPGIRR